jgi:hypothetical protein
MQAGRSGGVVAWKEIASSRGDQILWRRLEVVEGSEGGRRV